jgi:hypothetical protein
LLLALAKAITGFSDRKIHFYGVFIYLNRSSYRNREGIVPPRPEVKDLHEKKNSKYEFVFFYIPPIMSNKGNGVGRAVVFIMLGLIFGGILGESLGWLFGHIGTLMNAGGEDNVVRNFFVRAWELKMGYLDDGSPLLIDLYMLKFNLGFTLRLNIVSIIGVVGALYMMKWSGNR